MGIQSVHEGTEDYTVVVPLSIFSSIVVAASCYGMLVIVKDWEVFQDKKEMEWS